MFTPKYRSVTYLFLFFLITVSFLSLTGCGQRTESSPIPDFDYTGSDPKAIKIAEQVMEALGGKENWDNTRYIAWDWFGKRLNVWDKWTGRYRVASRVSLIILNLHTGEGKAWKFGHEMAGDDLKGLLEYGAEAWANDSYWLFAPYKLKDPGVTLKYLREDTTRDGRQADVISVTFNSVGVTPNNKYHLYIDKETKLLAQWSYFMDRDDAFPRFTTEWRNWQKYGDILISDDPGPGPRKKHKNIMVFQTLPDSVFQTSAIIDWEPIKKEYH
ncbi:MAG: hypothetical protein ACE5I1_10985 [bacterium]